MLGIMGIFGAKINFFNVLVFPIVIGYGIQNGIYIYYRFMEERNVGKTISRVGPAIIASTLTTLVGWGVLLIAEHRGLHSVGVTASIGIGSSLLVALTLLPSMLALVYAPKKQEEETQDVSVGLNIDTSTEEKAVDEVSEEDTIDLDAANSDSPKESIKDAPIDLDNISEDDSSIEISSNVDMHVKEEIREKLENLKDTPIDLDKELDDDAPEVSTPVKVDLNLKEDLKAKLQETAAKKKSPKKKPSTKKKANTDLSQDAPSEAKPVSKKKPASKKKK
jgi:predicted RND superfamily exporter protein